MQKDKKPKMKNNKTFSSSKNAKSLNMFQYGILIDQLYKDNNQMTNVEIYIHPDNIKYLCFLQYIDYKVQKEFVINLLDIQGISDKPLQEQHKKIQKKNQDLFFLGVQYNFVQQDRKHEFNEIVFIFGFESTKTIFWQGLQNIINEAKKDFEQHDTQILNILSDQNNSKEIQKFIKEKLPQINDFYLNQIINDYDTQFLEYITKKQVIEIIKDINLNQNLKSVFQQACDVYSDDPFKPCLKFQEFFKKFQTDKQGDKQYTEIFLIQNLRKINSNHDIRQENLTFYDFCYIIQDNNPILQNREKINESLNLNEFYIFHHVFYGKNLMDTIQKTLSKGCVYFLFTLQNGQLQIPLFKINDQEGDANKIIDLFQQKISQQDSFFILDFDVKCSNEQLNNLYSIIQKKLSNFIFKGNQLTLNLLKQKIIIFGEYNHKEFSQLAYNDFSYYSSTDASMHLSKNQKGITNDNKNGISHVKGSDFIVNDFFQAGYQIITLKSQGLEKLLYLSKFQKSGWQEFEPIYNKPQFLTQIPGKFPLQDFRQVQTKIEFEILYGFQMQCSPCYLQIQIRGITLDESKNGIFQSKIIESGLKPNFNFSMLFKLNCPELAFIQIQVFEKLYEQEDKLVSYTAINVQDIKTGIRKINLRDLQFDIIPNSYLMSTISYAE